MSDSGFDLGLDDASRAGVFFVTTDDIKAGLYDPYDGDIDPAQLTQALAKGARDAGVQNGVFHTRWLEPWLEQNSDNLGEES